MNDYSNPPQHHSSSTSTGMSLVSAVIGGAIVAVVFALLLAFGVIGNEKTTTVVPGTGGVATSTTEGSGDVKTVGAIYKQASPAVVSVKARVATSGDSPFGGGQQEGTASGTGFVISDEGYIVTNAHVVEGHKGSVTVVFNDDKSVDAKVVGSDPSNDVAVLKVDPGDHKLSTLALGDSSKVAVGDAVVAIGNPFGLNQTVTSGIVSALQRTISAPNNFSISNVIQTDAAINPGNSGGPLLDAAGRVIGINSQIATSGGSEGNVGIGFAVPINKVKEIVPQLEKDGKVEYAYLGVSTATLTTEDAKQLGVKGTDSGALVACVVNGGPADKAGIVQGDQQTGKGGDVIVKVAGKDVKTSEDVSGEVTQHKAGDEIDIVVVRGGKEKTLGVELGARPANTSNNCSPSSQQPEQPQQPGIPSP